MAMTRYTSLTQIAEFIGQIEAEPANTVRQRLKEWYQEATAKKGEHRQSLEVKNCHVADGARAAVLKRCSTCGVRTGTGFPDHGTNPSGAKPKTYWSNGRRADQKASRPNALFAPLA